VTPHLLHQHLERHAARAPEAVAVTDRVRSLGYGELDAISNRLAHVLQRHGVKKGDRVGIDLEKSVEAVVAMLGILKAGAAYVPIDPRAPAKRAAFVVADCRMQALVTMQARLEKLKPELEHVPPCLILLDDWSEIGAAPTEPPADPGLDAEDLAYILYTSGSTGEPKGVMLSHRAALAFVHWAVDCFALGPEDRLANHAPLHFDLSILDIFGALASGARVVLVPPAVSVFALTLADWIEASGISVWYSVPSALTQLALKGRLERHSYARLRLVLFAGEVFPVEHLRKLMQLWPRAEYFNLYGPTETNVCTVQKVESLPAEQTEPVAIGKACAGTEVTAIDDELYVRGPTLMHGYWGRPEQSKAVLTEKGYRTGDLVRRDADGAWHFVGRRDAQVKSRGYRIELGEVEAALYRHPGVEEAAVVARPHAEFGCTLHAVVVARPGSTLRNAELAAFCAERLPPYMIPADFEVREGALPKTSSGKVDRGALRK
jgi:amino acid adenylation domain-containing protein